MILHRLFMVGRVSESERRLMYENSNAPSNAPDETPQLRQRVEALEAELKSKDQIIEAQQKALARIEDMQTQMRAQQEQIASLQARVANDPDNSPRQEALRSVSTRQGEYPQVLPERYRSGSNTPRRSPKRPTKQPPVEGQIRTQYIKDPLNPKAMGEMVRQVWAKDANGVFDWRSAGTIYSREDMQANADRIHEERRMQDVRARKQREVLRNYRTNPLYYVHRDELQRGLESMNWTEADARVPQPDIPQYSYVDRTGVYGGGVREWSRPGEGYVYLNYNGQENIRLFVGKDSEFSNTIQNITTREEWDAFVQMNKDAIAKKFEVPADVESSTPQDTESESEAPERTERFEPNSNAPSTEEAPTSEAPNPTDAFAATPRSSDTVIRPASFVSTTTTASERARVSTESNAEQGIVGIGSIIGDKPEAAIDEYAQEVTGYMGVLFIEPKDMKSQSTERIAIDMRSPKTREEMRVQIDQLKSQGLIVEFLQPEIATRGNWKLRIIPTKAGEWNIWKKDVMDRSKNIATLHAEKVPYFPAQEASGDDAVA